MIFAQLFVLRIWSKFCIKTVLIILFTLVPYTKVIVFITIIYIYMNINNLLSAIKALIDVILKMVCVRVFLHNK